MRAISIVAATAGLAALAACGEGSAFDNGFRTSYREKAVEGCVTGARSAAPAGVSVDFQRVCACAVDRHMEGKSATELMRDDDQAAAQRATEQCLRETMGQSAAPAGAGGGSKPTR
jgi:hypothetical protein